MTDTVSSDNTALTPKPRGFQEGNPGRPKGAKNKATVMAERLMERDIKGVTNVIVGAALNGDLQACKIIMDKIVPQAKSRRVEFPMPLINAPLVEAPPPFQRTPAIEWDEFVAGTARA